MAHRHIRAMARWLSSDLKPPPNRISYAVPRLFRKAPKGHEQYLMFRRGQMAWSLFRALHDVRHPETDQTKGTSYQPFNAPRRGIETIFRRHAVEGDAGVTPCGNTELKE